MKKLSKRNINLILIFGFIFIILSGIIVLQYAFNVKNNECISNPLIYGAKQMKELTGVEFAGSGGYVKGNYPTYHFNSESFSVITIPYN